MIGDLKHTDRANAPRGHAARDAPRHIRAQTRSVLGVSTSDGNDHQRINSPPIMVTKTVPVAV